MKQKTNVNLNMRLVLSSTEFFRRYRRVITNRMAIPLTSNQMLYSMNTVQLLERTRFSEQRSRQIVDAHSQTFLFFFFRPDSFHATCIVELPE